MYADTSTPKYPRPTASWSAHFRKMNPFQHHARVNDVDLEKQAQPRDIGGNQQGGDLEGSLEQQKENAKERTTSGVKRKHERALRWLGRVGFFAKAVVYGIIGALTIANIAGWSAPNGSSGNESPAGVFLLIGGVPKVGRGLLVAMACGLIIYIIWRFWEAITGQGQDATFGKAKNFFRYRLSPFVSGCVYTAYLYYIIRMIFETSDQQQQSVSGKSFPNSWRDSAFGRFGLVLCGVAFAIAFLTQIVNAIGGGFRVDLKTSEPDFRPIWLKHFVHISGRIGFLGRAMLFGTVSVFMWDALAKPLESGQQNIVAAAITNLNTNAGGKFFLVFLGVCLIIYAIFALLNCKYKYFPTPPPTRHPKRGHNEPEPGALDHDRNPGAEEQLPPNGKECFFEDLERGDKLTVTYQVGDGGNLDIDFWMMNPVDHVIATATRESTGTYNIEAELDGRYTYCFSNMMSSVSEKWVSFNVHGLQHPIPDASEHIDPLEREIRDLADSISAVKDEQEYIVVRERQHRDTAESTNSRVVWWSLLQTALLIAVCLWQVFYLKRFFEVKRVV
ncbi:hypothetical protein BZG36_02953 [Bifiguratus adelaidae]|uniref:GOLD domain-containing protein n=1 Tax=Bifiguratus adelaidae TaxID=1938954 RepID=A0A261Y0R3_9FUNG|nr:hypothetical protein BZG36_02953 [Bifiguratus adelaidae]